MITVLQIIPHLGAGGAEQACIDVALGLKASGHKAIVMTAGGARLPEIEQAGVEIIIAPVHSKNPLRIVWNVGRLLITIRQHKVDVIHARSRAPAWSAWLSARLSGRTFVTTQHATYKFSNPIKKLYNSVMAKGDRVIAISDFIARHILKTYHVDPLVVRTILRGIDLPKFSPESIDSVRCEVVLRSWNIQSYQRIILVPSRISPIKGQVTVIEAMTLLSPELQDVKAIIIGDDQGRVSYREKLQNLIDEHHLRDRVQIAGHCHDMPAAYRCASLVVAPSLVPEGFGRVPVEAMMMGVPVIATRLGGFVETIQEGETGWLVDPDNAVQLAEAIQRVLNLSETQRDRYIKAAQKKARALYDKKKMVADTLAVYSEVTQS